MEFNKGVRYLIILACIIILFLCVFLCGRHFYMMPENTRKEMSGVIKGIKARTKNGEKIYDTTYRTIHKVKVDKREYIVNSEGGIVLHK